MLSTTITLPLITNTSWITWEAEALLQKAELLFGSRDSRFRYAGISFSGEGPKIRFPLQGAAVCIELGWAVLNFPDQARYQAAHETIHVLSPSSNAPMIEEGLAVWFSLNGPDYRGSGYESKARAHTLSEPSEKNYADALLLYEELEKTEPNSIARLRAQQPNFTALSPQFICDILPKVSRDLAERCCEVRNMR